MTKGQVLNFKQDREWTDRPNSFLEHSTENIKLNNNKI